ncbi:tail fiber domain-containing protein [Frigidibacter oleivorans]|uniref:tail fiber domain-containing protein n=1 Tax=Frigidibacter oleivorans TaxID=2487129 RepID=UPI000F8E59CF|nr:tail fiber domain-containing protein [Frigidibacter oleivorans]
MGNSYDAPEADPQIGQAAMISARTGAEFLDFMKSQAEITNSWALEDREREQTVFQPLQDQYIAEAQGWDSAERKQSVADQAVADVQNQSALAAGQRSRSMMAMGVDPTSGRYAAETQKGATDTALASAGAANMSRRTVEAEADAKMANAINMGAGLAVNPATSMGLSNGAVSAGANGAMQGYNQAGSLLNTQYQQELQSSQMAAQSQMQMFGSLGMMAGAFMSSEKVKEDKRPFDALAAVEKMPVEKWRYKAGVADEGEHVGPYAEDFAAATGVGDGTTIDPITAMGVTMGAVQQLAKKVDALTQKKAGKTKPKPMGVAA